MAFSQYKAFLFDVDKTLTNSKKELTPRTLGALSYLSKTGIRTGICTGRHFATLKNTLQNFSGESLHVTSGGAQVINSAGEVQFQKLIPREVVADILALADQFHGKALVQTESEIYGNTRAVAEWVITGSNNAKILDLSLFHPSPVPILVVDDVSDGFFDALQKYPMINSKRMRSYKNTEYADITPVGVHKGSGIREWCRITGIKPEEIIGFGDSENDIEFLQTVGYSIAMGNANESVKNIADEITADCDHDGVAEWIEKRILTDK